MTENRVTPTNWFVRILVILFVIFLCGLAVLDVTHRSPAFSIGGNIFLVLCLITVLVLAEAFNSLSLGKILILSRDISKKDIETKTLKQENNSLRESLLNITTRITQSQTNLTFNGANFDQLRQAMGLIKAPQEEIEKSKQETIAEDTAQIQRTGSSQHQPRPSFNFEAARSAEAPAIRKFLESKQLSVDDLKTEMKFTPALAGADPIMNRDPIFDGYIKTEYAEYLIEVRQYRLINPIFFDRFYVMLSKTLRYRELKKTQAKLVLILIKMPDEDSDSGPRYFSAEKLITVFEPAINNNLLEVFTVEFTKDEINNFVKKK